jgi:hypothetical protein
MSRNLCRALSTSAVHALAKLRYGTRMGLVACPFCRELFEKGEVPACPVCGLKLAAMEKLPISHDAAAEEFVPTIPEQEVQSAFFLKRARGPLALIGALGVVLFFLPWIDVRHPQATLISGFMLARIQLWPGTALAAWMVMVPTVLSRRTILEMRRARIPVAFLTSIPATTVLLTAFHKQKIALYTLSYQHTAAFWGTLALSALGFLLALRFGGALDDIELKAGSAVAKQAKRTSDETLH